MSRKKAWTSAQTARVPAPRGAWTPGGPRRRARLASSGGAEAAQPQLLELMTQLRPALLAADLDDAHEEQGQPAEHDAGADADADAVLATVADGATPALLLSPHGCPTAGDASLGQGQARHPPARAGRSGPRGRRGWRRTKYGGGRSSPQRHSPNHKFKQEHHCLYSQLKPAARDRLGLAHRPPCRLCAACDSEEPRSARLAPRARTREPPSPRGSGRQIARASASLREGSGSNHQSAPRRCRERVARPWRDAVSPRCDLAKSKLFPGTVCSSGSAAAAEHDLLVPPRGRRGVPRGRHTSPNTA